MGNVDPKLKKIGIAFIIGACIFIVVAVFFRIFTTGTVEITVDKPGYTAEIRRLRPNATHETHTLTKTTSSFSVETGDYIVTISNQDGSAKQLTKVEFFHTSKINLKVSPAVGSDDIEPVTSYGASFTASDGKVLRFINKNPYGKWHYYSINTSNQVTDHSVDDEYKDIYRAANWDYTQHRGLLLSDDLYLFNGDQKTAQSLSVQGLTSSLSPNGDIYVSKNDGIYRKDGSNKNTGFSKIYSKNDNAKVISSSNNHVFISHNTKVGREGGVAVVNKDGHITVDSAGEVYEANFSPDGKKLLLSGDKNGVFDTQLNKIQDIPSSNSVNPSWINADTVVYGDSKAIWKYELSSKKSSKIADLAKIPGFVNYAKPDKDGKYVYISSQRSDSSNRDVYKLFRVRIDKKTAKQSPVVQKLNLVLPYAVENCYFDFVNFGETKPSVTIRAQRDSAEKCNRFLIDHLTTYNISADDISIQPLLSSFELRTMD